MGDSMHASPPGYRSFYSQPVPGQGHHGGTAILVRSDVPCVFLQCNSPLQAVAVRIFITSFYTICSLYLPPGDRVDKPELVNLVRDIPPPFLLLGDFNGRHPLWDEDVINPRGTLIASFIEDEDLEVLNSGDVTHFHSATGTFTSIDLSLCSSSIFLEFRWSVLSDLYGSDHFPIIIKSDDSVPQPRLPRWRLDKADWQLFSDLSVPSRLLSDMENCDTAAQYFSDLLHSAGLQSIPRTRGRFPKRPVPWWNADCTAAVREKRAAFSRLKRHRGDNFCLEYFRRARAKARRTLKSAQRTSWRSYVSSLNSRTPLNAVFNRVRKISGKFTPPPPPVLLRSGEPVADPKEVADMFATHFISVSRKDAAAPGALYRRTLESGGLSFASPGGESYNVAFSRSELQAALSQCPDSSPGLDDIPYAFLRYMSESAFIFILDLYNLIWSTGDFPSSWSVAVVLPIHKPGKDPLQTTNYRPISLTSCLCKVMEKMVNVRLMWFLESHRCLTPVQYGFRRARSTTDALLTLESSICRAFAHNHHHVTVFFDLEKAYDTAWRHGILLRLHWFGLRGRLPTFI